MSTEQKRLTEGNARHPYEFLQLINDAETVEKRIELMNKWCKGHPMDMVFHLNFNKNVSLDLPEGAPPYKRDEQTHPDMMTPLAGQIQRLKACLKDNNIKKIIKERTFIQVIEMVPAGDADLIIAAKDKKLEELYPNITKEFVKSVFPAYVVE